MIRETALYLLLLITCALLMHPDLLSDPAARFSQMQNRGNHLHPLLYTALIYLVLLLFRAIVRITARLFGLRTPSH